MNLETLQKRGRGRKKHDLFLLFFSPVSSLSSPSAPSFPLPLHTFFFPFSPVSFASFRSLTCLTANFSSRQPDTFSRFTFASDALPFSLTNAQTLSSSFLFFSPFLDSRSRFFVSRFPSIFGLVSRRRRRRRRRWPLPVCTRFRA